MPTLTKLEALQARDNIEMCAIWALARDPLDMEILSTARGILREVNEAVNPIELGVVELLNAGIKQYGDPDPETGNLRIPPGSLSADLVDLEIKEFLMNGSVEIESDFDFAAFKKLLGIPEKPWRLSIS